MAISKAGTTFSKAQHFGYPEVNFRGGCNHEDHESRLLHLAFLLSLRMRSPTIFKKPLGKSRRIAKLLGLHKGMNSTGNQCQEFSLDFCCLFRWMECFQFQLYTFCLNYCFFLNGVFVPITITTIHCNKLKASPRFLSEQLWRGIFPK